MLVSRPACENRQMSAVPAPLAGRARTTGFPESEQVFVPVEKVPSAAMLRSTLSPGRETPEVFGSTTTMSLPEAVGALLVRAMLSLLMFGGATTNATIVRKRAVWI